MSQYLSIKDVAEWLNVDYKTIYRLIRQNELPAAKVGGVYRISREDVEHYVEQPTYASTPAVTPAQATPAPLKCGVCQRLLRDANDVGGRCTDPHCTAVICNTCWTKDERRYCAKHQPTHADLLRAAQTAGTPTRLLVAPEARRREQNYIARFDTKVRRITKLWHPLQQQVITPPRPWDALHLESDAVETLMVLMHTGFLSENLEREMPLNVASRYTLPGAEARPGMILEAQVLSDLPKLVKQGFTAEPLGVDALMPVLERCAKMAEAQSAAYLIGLAATSGWSAEAIAVVAGDVGRTYHHPRVLPCLVDLESFTLIFNAQDARIAPLAALFTPRLPEEELEYAITLIEHELASSHSVAAADLLSEPGIDTALIHRAFAHLVQQGTHRIETLPDIGEVIVRTES